MATRRPMPVAPPPARRGRLGIDGLLVVAFFSIAPFARPFEQNVLGVRFDPADIFLIPALALTVFSGQRRSLRALPMGAVFLVYLILTAAAYARAVLALGELSDPARALYQFYRYAWRPALVFPMTYMFIRNRRAGDVMPILLFTVIVTADVHSIAGIWQGRHGLDASGFLGAMGDKNSLAGSLLLPAFLALGVSAHPARLWKAFAYGSIATMVVMFWYSTSRGGVLAFGIGLVAFAALSKLRLRLIGGASVGVLMLFAACPDFGKHSGIRARFLEIMSGTDASTLEWRLTERWPHFLNKVSERPWLGTGSEVDPSLGALGNTPHNGYLGLAVRSGLPSLALFAGFLAFTLVRSAAIARTGRNLFERNTGAAAFGGAVALSVHNLVDSTFGVGSTAYLFWMLCGSVAALPRSQLHRGSARHEHRSSTWEGHRFRRTSGTAAR